jgi:DNA-binding NtrC family response regulator
MLPSLGERIGDIPQLVKYFIRRAGPELGIDSPSIQPEAITFLQSQIWPGNVRELENTVRQSLLLARGYPVSPDHVQQSCLRSRKPVAASDQSIDGYFTELLTRAQRGELTNLHARMIEDMERELYTRTIQIAEGNQAKAARWLGVTRTTMREKLIRFGLHSVGEKP